MIFINNKRFFPVYSKNKNTQAAFFFAFMFKCNNFKRNSGYAKPSYAYCLKKKKYLPRWRILHNLYTLHICYIH